MKTLFKFVNSFLLLLSLVVPVSLNAETNSYDPIAQVKARCSIFTHPLYYGMNTKNVRQEFGFLQYYLLEREYFGLNQTELSKNTALVSEFENAKFGKYTLAAVKKFQKDNGVLAIGSVGPATRKKLKESCLAYLNSPQFQVSIEVARAKGTDAQIKSILANMRAQAEIVYDQNNYSYASLCGDKYVLSGLADIEKTVSVKPVCIANSTSYAISSILKTASSTSFCVDSTGFANNGATQLNSGIATCAGLNAPAPIPTLPPISIPQPLPQSTVPVLFSQTDYGFDQSYQAQRIDISVTAGTANQPVSNWDIRFACPVSVTIITVPGDACGSFQMGTNGTNYGNILNKDFYFKNNTNSTEYVPVIVNAYDSAGRLMGTTNSTIIVLANSLGPQSFSQVTLTYPNGGQVLHSGSTVYVTWAVKPGSYPFNFTSSSRTVISFVKGNALVKDYNFTTNTGQENIVLPMGLVSGNDYKMLVAVYNGENGQMDDSDTNFSIVQ